MQAIIHVPIAALVINSKKMKKQIFSIVALSMLFLVSVSLKAQEKYMINSDESKLTWLGKKVTGEHTGHIMLKSGMFMFNHDGFTKGEFVIDMNSITCTDIEDKEYNGKLVGHLKSDDFFGVANFPTAKFVIKGSKMAGDHKYKVMGDLTIKGITHPLEFEVMVKHKGEALMVSGKAIVDRSKYNVKYGSKSFFDNLGDKVIYDDFELAFDIKTK